MSLRAVARTSGRRSKEGRRRREDNTVEIRKSRREGNLLKKGCDGLPADAAGAPQMGHSSAPPAEILLLLSLSSRLSAISVVFECNGADTPGVTSKKEKAWKDPNKPPQEGRVYVRSFPQVFFPCFFWVSFDLLGEFDMEFKEKNPKNKSVAAALFG